MCGMKDCERHELWGGLCLTHLREALNPKPKRRRKKIDAVEVMTTDADAAVERTDNEA